MKLKIQFIALFTIIIWISLFQQAFSQTNKYKKNIVWGEENKLKLGETTEKILYDDGQYIYVLSHKIPSVILMNDHIVSVKPTITKYDSKMKPIISTQIATGNESANYHDSYFLGGKFYGLTSVVDKSSGTRKFYTCNLNSELKEVGRDILVWEAHGNSGDSLNCRFSVSPDTSSYLISYINGKGKNPCELQFCSFDQEMKSKTNKTEKEKIPKK